ncbi:gp09 [Rhodococcus phage ReqiPine5]|uniref:Gp09 n=1 Tax=Rhodococcus phage ReqiPine5 TaxID=691963 RepID=D4P7Y4_9CAUD|nr:gp09 [Rhodococcus phage ReqiPine5]ADD81114.1 gp09 [Rhodococcus phage ReqiPine5]
MDYTAYLLFLVLLGSFATYRITRVLTYDDISVPLRLAILRRVKPSNPIATFIQCPWCVSIWIGAFVALYLTLAFDLSWWLFLPMLLVFSAVTGFIAAKYDTDTEDVD